MEQAVGWVRQYRQELAQGQPFLEVSTIVEQFVKIHGILLGGAPLLQERLAATGTLPRTQQLRAELLQFVREESAKAKAGERLVGSREVIDSIFGKWKRLEGEHARSGLPGLVLALAFMTWGVATTDEKGESLRYAGGGHTRCRGRVALVPRARALA